MPAYLDVAERSWPFLRHAFGAHGVLYRATGGLIGHHLPGLPPFLLLEHVGAKSGKRRTTPLLYVRDGERYVVVASKGGHPRHPAWLHNLRAHPDTTIQVGRRRIPVRAREARAEERDRLWAKAVAAWRAYEDYQARTEREIPLVILEPRRARG
jgi:deazaflavin-dependent oxidoreductase (nitroreductase family)